MKVFLLPRYFSSADGTCQMSIVQSCKKGLLVVENHQTKHIFNENVFSLEKTILTVLNFRPL